MGAATGRTPLWSASRPTPARQWTGPAWRVSRGARIHRSSEQMATPSPPGSAPTMPSALTQAPTGRVRRIECAASRRGRQWRNAPPRAPTSGSARRARGLQRVPRMGAAVAERCTRHHGGEVRPRSRVSHAPCRPQPPPRGTGGVHPQRHHGRPVAAPGGVVVAGVVMAAMDGLRLPGVCFLRAAAGSAPPWQDHPVRRRGGEHVGRLPRGMGRWAVGSRPAAPHGGSERWISRPSSPLRGVPRLDVAEGQRVKHVQAPARSRAVSSMLSPPARIDPITVNAFEPLFAPCRAGRSRWSISSPSPIRCPSTAAGGSPASGSEPSRCNSPRPGSSHEMLAPVRCAFVTLLIDLSQDQSSTPKGHLHVHGTPALTERWIRARTLRVRAGQEAWNPSVERASRSGRARAQLLRGDLRWAR